MEKNRGIRPVSKGLENADCEKIHSKKRKNQTQSSEKAGSILDDGWIVHKQSNQVSGKNK